MLRNFRSPSSRSQARRIGRREGIVAVAKAAFLDNGYAGTTMSRIAEKLGGSKGTLWSYFPSKSLLFTAVVDRASQELYGHLSPILNAQDDVAAVLLRFSYEFVQKITSSEAVALYRIVAAEGNRFPEAGAIFYDRAIGRSRELLTCYLAEATRRGALHCDEPPRAALHLISLCLYGCQQQLLFGVIEAVDCESLSRDVKQGVAVFLRAYATFRL